MQFVQCCWMGCWLRLVQRRNARGHGAFASRTSVPITVLLCGPFSRHYV